MVPGSLLHTDCVVSRMHASTAVDVADYVQQAVVRTQGGNCKVCIATAVMEHGLNCVDTVRVIHNGSPASIEAYVQGLGRAGRVSGIGVWSCLYYNKTDFSHVGRGVSRDMQAYCLNTTRCRNEMLSQIFGEDAFN